MSTTVTRRWPVLRVTATSHLPFIALLWVPFVVVTLAVAGFIAMGGTVSHSAIHVAATQLPRWLMFGLGLDMVSNTLRMHLAHGRTRREFVGQGLVHAVLMSGFAAVLIALAYLVERGVYAMFGWPQALNREAMFATADDYPVILGTYWLLFLTWTIAGLVIGLGFFHSNGLGLLTIPIGLAIALPTVLFTGNSGFPVIGDELVDLDLSEGLLLALNGGLLVLAVGIIWAIARHVPMKAKAP
ncbi:hypothetical protein [Actinophytocola xanthii]|uniref:Uncharacterized protein n=1 Tax=Actinophytocola xanthii TaxID=1912961 RepID=A0A1Q8CXC2_9PSEU|nr:hypothetical protein [Actinophytocola xanthii]OLF19008.1 hypothetical protein BU204_03930 [Actinophytocola xanthii]